MWPGNKSISITPVLKSIAITYDRYNRLVFSATEVLLLVDPSPEIKNLQALEHRTDKFFKLVF